MLASFSNGLSNRILNLIEAFAHVLDFSIPLYKEYSIKFTDNKSIDEMNQSRFGHKITNSFIIIITDLQSSAWGPVDVLLLLAGFTELVAAIIVSILGCHAACCGKRIPSVCTQSPFVYHVAILKS